MLNLLVYPIFSLENQDRLFYVFPDLCVLLLYHFLNVSMVIGAPANCVYTLCCICFVLYLHRVLDAFCKHLKRLNSLKLLAQAKSFRFFRRR